MDTVSLPVFRKEEQPTLEQALAQCRHRSRAGVILESGDNYNLLYLGRLYEAQGKGISLLADVPRAHPVRLLSGNDASTYSLDLVRPIRTRTAYEGFLRTFAAEYALAGLTSDTAMIVTASESLTRMLSLTGGYECNGNPKHFFPDPEVVPGQNCPNFPECGYLPGKRIPIISAIP